MNMGTSVCVVTMDRPDTLLATLQSLYASLAQPYEIIVVDNASTNDQQLRILDDAETHGVKVIRNTENLGLSMATNQGFEAASFDTLIHMDDDVLIHQSGWNHVMSSYMETYPKVGMVVPSSDGLSIQRDGYREITWGLGMCWAIRKAIVDDIGGYDPQLWHQNECDMALRVRMAGYHVAGIQDVHVIHNDPGGTRSDLSLAREHLGCVQFRDKWTSYFRGRDWTYGTQPLYLMQHWPPDQEFFRLFALQNGVNLNPPPDVAFEDWPMAGQPHDPEKWGKLDHLRGQQSINIQGYNFLIYRDLRNDYCHWEWMHNPEGYNIDRDKAIERWFELTGVRYDGYKWKSNLLRPY